MKQNSQGVATIMLILIVVALVGGVVWLILSNGNFLPSTTDNVDKVSKQLSQECEVCGRQGLHNPSGLNCASGLICVDEPNNDGKMVNGSYCLKAGEQYFPKCSDYYDSLVRPR